MPNAEIYLVIADSGIVPERCVGRLLSLEDGESKDERKRLAVDSG